MKALSLLFAVPLLAACATRPAAAPSLIGSSWTFASIDGATPVGKQTSLRFEPDRLGANAGCNGMGGSWKQEGDRIVVGSLVSTMMFCDGIMEQERAVARLLEGRPAAACF